MGDLHVVFTVYPEMVAIESPQIPGLVGGRTTPEAALADLDEILELAGVTASSYDRVIKHEQRPFVSPAGNEYLVRMTVEDEDEVRDTSAGRMVAAIEQGLEDADEHLERHPALATGERLFIAVIGSDTMGWCMDQLDGDYGAVIEWNRDDDACWGLPLMPEDNQLNSAYSLEDLGLTRESTVAECFDRVTAREINDMSHSYIRTAIAS